MTHAKQWLGSSMRERALPLILLAACGGPTDAQLPAQPSNAAAATTVRVEVNAAAPHQVMEGFGATTAPLIYQNGADDKVPPALRTRAVQAAYRDVRLTLGNVEIGQWEPANDDADPQHINEPAFEVAGLRAINDKLMAPARALGADGLYPGNVVSMNATEWLKPLRDSDYNRYIDECAEYVVSAVLKWRDVTGQIPRYHALFNEAIWGNQDLKGGNTKEIIDIIKRAGGRLRSAGMPTKFVIASEYSAAQSAALSKEVLADPQARQYVGAIGYHVYPYGSAFSSMPLILAGPGAGRRDEAALADRRALRDLGRQYDVPVWMDEVSHGELDPRSMDAVRARAIHIHDELEYADASAFFGMHAMWDSKSNSEHFGAGRSLLKEEDTIVLIDVDAGSVLVTGTGYAIGHYARWVQRGATRVEATSADPLVLVSAFTNRQSGKASFVIINNDATSKAVRVHLSGLTLAGALTGEQSSGDARWKALGSIALDGDAKDAFVVTVPAKSVTSLGASY
jgi:O-glycosyl hydrolase